MQELKLRVFNDKGAILHLTYTRWTTEVYLVMEQLANL